MSTQKENVVLQPAKPFGAKDTLGYLSGNLALDFTYTLCTSYMLKFYTDVIGVDAYIVGILMMIAQVVDAVTDLTMGQIIDRSPMTPKGKFRPWLKRAAAPMALTSFLMYACWMQGVAMWLKIVWMFVTYLLYTSVFYTMAIIPYGSMASAISNDPNHRTVLSNMRHIGGTLAMTFLNIIIPLTVYYKDANGNEVFSGVRMTTAAFCFSLLAFILFMICYFWCSERVPVPQQNEKFNVGAFLGDLVHNKSLIVILFVILIQECSNSAFHGMSGYVFPNYFGNAAVQSLASTLETIVCLVIAAGIVFVVAKVGKKEITVIGTLICTAAFLFGYIVHTHSVWVWLGIYLVVTVGLSLFNPVTFALVTDIVDDEEVRTGKRIDGTIYSVYSFGRKFGSAVSSGVRGVMLSMIGYTAATAFDENVVNGIYNISCIVPMIGFGLMCLVIAFFYPLSKKKVEENVRILKERRGEIEEEKEE